LRRHVVRTALACTLIQIRADRSIPVKSELARRFAVPLVPAGRVMDQRHAGKGTGTEWARDVRRDALSLVACDRYGHRQHVVVCHGLSSLLLPKPDDQPVRSTHLCEARWLSTHPEEIKPPAAYRRKRTLSSSRRSPAPGDSSDGR